MTSMTNGLADSRPQYRARNTHILNILTVTVFLLSVASLYMGLFWAGTDIQQGEVQRIFYLHVGSYVGGFTAFLTTVVAGLMYLWKRDLKWDRLALASVEVGLPMMTVTLLTGMAWARPIWNTWWTSDPRLNSMAVMWLIYAAYLTLRGSIDDPERRARFAAIYGILAFISVIYVFIVIRIRPDTLHPVVVGPSPVESANVQGDFEVRTDSRIGATMAVASFAWMLLPLVLIWYRVRVENLAQYARVLKARLLGETQYDEKASEFTLTSPAKQKIEGV